MDTLSGEIVKVLNRAEEGGWAVIHVRGADGALTTAVGCFPRADDGLLIEAEGQWGVHPTFGRQFRVELVRVFPPRDAAGIERFLASGAVHGIGTHFAQKIVRRYKERTLDIIRSDPWTLKALKGVGDKRVQAVIDGVAAYYADLEVLSFLHQQFGPARAARIFDRYGREARSILAKEPYRLVEDFDGIGFGLADRVARDVGMSDAHPQRLKAAVTYAMKAAAARGDTSVESAKLVAHLGELLGGPPALAEQALDVAVQDGLAHRVSHDVGCAYELAHYRWLEERVVARLRSLMSARRSTPAIAADRAVPWAEQQVGLTFEAEQAAAIRLALDAKVSVITGGPGVGKTTILKGLLAILRAKRVRVVLGAPTGRAARRMADSTGLEADTVHKLLGAEPGRHRFRFNAGQRLDADAVIVDEASMMDLGLTRALLEALPDAAQLVFVGDQDQLPSVGPGQVLADLIASGVVPVARLSRPFRQAAGSPIIRAAHAVNHGEAPDLGSADGPFAFVETADAAATAAAIVHAACEQLPAEGFHPRSDIMVLVPMNRGPLGIETLNEILQRRLNPDPPAAVERGGRRFGVGDRVIQRRNDRDLAVFNGDVGAVRSIDAAAKTLRIDFDGREVEYPFGALAALDLAYAITVHRSQGSEYPAAIVAVDTSTTVLLDRKLVYTAITRAKRRVVVIGQRRAVHIAVSAARANVRSTLLAGRLAATFASGLSAPGARVA
jgi:exodeoxyribonuclease V alpha subunit